MMIGPSVGRRDRPAAERPDDRTLVSPSLPSTPSSTCSGLWLAPCRLMRVLRAHAPSCGGRSVLPTVAPPSPPRESVACPPSPRRNAYPPDKGAEQARTVTVACGEKLGSFECAGQDRIAFPEWALRSS